MRRNLAIAAALTDAAPRASVLLTTGCNDFGSHGLAPNVEVLALPGVRKLDNGRYAARRLPVSGREVRSLRSAQLKAAVESFRPDVMLVDKHPTGLRGELRPALDEQLGRGGRAVLGMRDVLDDAATVAREWTEEGAFEEIGRYFDRLLVYGDPRVLDFAAEYGLPADLAGLARYCGYVVHPETAHPGLVDSLPESLAGPVGRPVVLATAGGGEDGWHLLERFIGAAASSPWRAHVVSGPRLATAESQALRSAAGAAGVSFRGSVPDVARWFPHVDALVCMGGYNTLSEALSSGTPTVCVPRVTPRREQLIRARAFAGLGLLRTLEPALLSPRALAREVSALVGASRDRIREQAGATLPFDGAQRAAAELLAVARAPRRAARTPLHEVSAG